MPGSRSQSHTSLQYAQTYSHAQFLNAQKTQRRTHKTEQDNGRRFEVSRARPKRFSKNTPLFERKVVGNLKGHLPFGGDFSCTAFPLRRYNICPKRRCPLDLNSQLDDNPRLVQSLSIIATSGHCVITEIPIKTKVYNYKSYYFDQASLFLQDIKEAKFVIHTGSMLKKKGRKKDLFSYKAKVAIMHNRTKYQEVYQDRFKFDKAFLLLERGNQSCFVPTKNGPLEIKRCPVGLLGNPFKLCPFKAGTPDFQNQITITTWQKIFHAPAKFYLNNSHSVLVDDQHSGERISEGGNSGSPLSLDNRKKCVVAIHSGRIEGSNSTIRALYASALTHEDEEMVKALEDWNFAHPSSKVPAFALSTIFNESAPRVASSSFTESLAPLLLLGIFFLLWAAGLRYQL